ncbi:GNAT family N-acetyltransferase [Dyadobacter arcticus]|uniref:GNAT superfamily N-acetyltransferase n=1 Tax=Dyadobacter arcticus TaxID=1078754 RepID=A0ABX0UU63_9BACT|nr:GNAT family N-acetyltransferase [Dyadobacter arcticus]NIJ55280.1 GNAT superfamily N-acetyltransferase [Dyadobacter arcticus]
MINITRTDSNNPDFQKLTNKLDIELCRIYNTQPKDYEEYNRITDLGTVVLVYFNSDPIACGCFKKLDETTVELKRMYVDSAFRGRGIGSTMVKELENWAMGLGSKAVVLETGKKQPEAIAMYRKLGYHNISGYSKDTETDNSVCMKKTF